MQLDHVLIAVDDLATAAKALETTSGLSAVAGGRHAAWGTGNMIVPLGDAYIELVSVLDRTKAQESVFGRWVGAASSNRGRPIGWAVRTHHLDDIAQRLGLATEAGSRATSAGTVLRWRTSGMARAVAEPSLPFFIEWAPDTPLPGTAVVRHPAGPAKIARLILEGDASRLSSWLGDHRLPIVIRPGSPAVAGIAVSIGLDEVLLGVS